MQSALILALVLHVLSGVFWAGSTFVMARGSGDQAKRLFRPQMGAALVAVASGAALWLLLHRGTPGIQERLLEAGAVSALLAAAVQAFGARAMRLASIAGAPDALATDRPALSQRIAAALLAITVICMAAARYA
ncbi:MAG: hypothetical protein JO000_31730 [Alphaproteobacteria bacterium]|nr:hypothetical protein [Alphaproteobacteria bacterium]